jgi:hypothetical protein
MPGNQNLKVCYELGVSAERQLGLDSVLLRRQPELLQSPSFSDRPWLIGHVGEG